GLAANVLRPVPNERLHGHAPSRRVADAGEGAGLRARSTRGWFYFSKLARRREAPTASVHPPLASRPERFAQFAAEDFSRRAARQGLVAEHDALGGLVVRDAVACEGDDGAFVLLRAGLGHHDRRHRFAPGVVRHADDRDLGHRGMAVDRVLDLGRIDVLRARTDHVLDAVLDEEIAVLVDVARVSGAQPAFAVDG